MSYSGTGSRKALFNRADRPRPAAAFDTVDHRLLLDHLLLEFGVTATVLDWIQSYLKGRSHFVKIGQHQSSTIGVDVGVPQGSVLGPLLFSVYCSPVADVIAHHGIQYRHYTDDTQLHHAMRADNTTAGLSILA